MLVDFSNPELYNPKFLPLFSSRKRYAFLMGGSGSGKSKAQAQNEVIASYEPGNRLLGVRKVADTIKESVFAELEGVIAEWELSDDFEITKSPMRILNRATGSDMIFRGLDNVEKLKSVKGVTRIWGEEATEFDEGDFDQLDLRLRGIGKRFSFVLTFNPVSDQHWLIKKHWNHGDGPERLLIHSTYLDNRFVDRRQYEVVFDRLKVSNPNLYNIYAKGIPGKAVEGLVYEYGTIPRIPLEARLVGYGLDFGYNHPACLAALYEWNGGIVIDQEFHKSGMLNPDIVAYLEKAGIGPENEIIADNSRPEAIEEISRAGFRCVACKKGPDSVINGISLVKSMKLWITARSDGIRKDFDNYVWAKDRDGKPLDVPVKAFDDGPDAVRYGISRYYAGSEEPEVAFAHAGKRRGRGPRIKPNLP